MANITAGKAARDMLKSINITNETMREYGGGTLRHILWLLASGEHTFTGLAEKLDRQISQVSRSVRTLHKLNYTGAEGLNLVDITFDLHNPRIKLVELNENGWALLRAEYKAITGNTIK